MNSTALRLVEKPPSRVRRERYTRHYTLSHTAHEELKAVADYYGLSPSSMIEYLVRERYRLIEQRERKREREARK